MKSFFTNISRMNIRLYIPITLAILSIVSLVDVLSTNHETVKQAVAVLDAKDVKGEVTFDDEAGGVRVKAKFTELSGQHGFHIHKAGDLRGEGCKGACDHYHVGSPQAHGGPPGHSGGPPGHSGGPPGHGNKGERHTGDLGNVTKGSYNYHLKGITVNDLLGRSIIIHADKDDLGLGGEADSLTTGHSGARIACAIIGRAKC
jgi:Cu-Zn family superoxide dismutase